MNSKYNLLSLHLPKEIKVPFNEYLMDFCKSLSGTPIDEFLFTTPTFEKGEVSLIISRIPQGTKDAYTFKYYEGAWKVLKCESLN